ncbi:XRE family transcriptional regulator [Sphingobium sp.]|uniref:helix-turn-helix domain-containing protein n=1 Tax=Sphingobium sp. TaxID=1912891 RepID=UPI002B71B50F|nr:XRE family transcriptional regulator [Sphingobium sp.]HUD92476.1 XRE family transcriptional regulator [Sphingobium sp.]
MTGTARSTLGSALRAIRKERRWSLAEASKHTGLAISTLSKIENGQRSLTYDKLIELAGSLQVDIARLFSGASDGSTASHALLGRRSVQRDGDGFTIEAGVYSYRYLAEDLINKRFSPIVMDLHARSVQAFDGLLRHAGEEFAFVIEGEVELHTELYAPLKLKAGESVYFDSNIGHAYLNAGDGPARILTIASSPIPNDNPLDLPVALPAQS